MYDDVAAEFETHRPKMKAVARRLLASDADTDDAVQEAWVRLQRTDRASIDNPWGVVDDDGRADRTQPAALARDQARNAVGSRFEVERSLAHPDPEIDVLLAETVGSALQVVVDTLTPAERVAFVLHDAFGFYAEIGRVLNRSSEARQLASRGRGRIRHTDPSDLDSAIPAAEQIVVDAFPAAKGGDLNALVDVLDPQIVERIAVAGQPVIEVRGAESVASRA